MREKKLYIIITFNTTTDAMETETLCKKSNIKCRIIPVPREISAGCGLALRILPDDYDRFSKLISSEIKNKWTVTELLL